MSKPQLWTIHGLAVEFGINNKTMKKRLEGLEPFIVEFGINKFLLADVWQHLLDREGKLLNTSQEAAKLNSARRKKVEMETEILMGNYVKVEELERQLITPVMNARTKLLALPTKLATLVPAIDTVEEAQQILEAQIHETLSELADGRLVSGMDTTDEDNGK